MFTIYHSSRQCNIPFDKVRDHNSYIQVCNAPCKMTVHRAKGRSNIRGDTVYQRTNIRRHNSTFLWELGFKTAGIARARELDRPRRTTIKMAEETHSPEETSANFYSFAYTVVEQTIARLESFNDLSEMDGLIMRLECLNRSLAYSDSPDTDEIMLLIGEAISCMSRDRSLSQRRGRPSFEIKQAGIPPGTRI